MFRGADKGADDSITNRARDTTSEAARQSSLAPENRLGGRCDGRWPETTSAAASLWLTIRCALKLTCSRPPAGYDHPQWVPLSSLHRQMQVTGTYVLRRAPTYLGSKKNLSTSPMDATARTATATTGRPHWTATLDGHNWMAESSGKTIRVYAAFSEALLEMTVIPCDTADSLQFTAIPPVIVMQRLIQTAIECALDYQQRGAQSE
ncbi:hypothetical protein B0T26DRAFT_751764 [Lasiosphaeria miniovina]|uniref:Uncharacterized protein n=1 Tax=Lasiosphaeria miniovina TaxID=1954250 RepID=A0AA40E014_9PEZI|nr:uncharacterized protein B0T26DRAFT_751764 [Lasiosphaeria miniovina]KAK0717738.1 hypothetical protein B0T26DRAFT_751764 [Lasiosphaeria miniovina]